MESRIKNIQEKYWSGNTSVDEENILKDPNAKNDLSDLENKYFSYLKEQSENSPKIEFTPPTRKIRFPYRMAAASIVILLVASSYFTMFTNNQDEFLVEDPEQAYAITKEALLTISNGMSRGEVYTEQLMKFDDAQQIVVN